MIIPGSNIPGAHSIETTEAIPLRYCFYALSDTCIFCYKVDDRLFRDAPHTPVSVGSELA